MLKDKYISTVGEGVFNLLNTAFIDSVSDWH